MEPRPIQITPQQALQITDSVLSQMIDWVKAKNGVNEHGKRNDEAVKSLFHSRLLLGIKAREMTLQAQQAQQAAAKQRPLITRPLQPIDERYIEEWKMNRTQSGTLP
jgi:predicted nuclease of restriction endonuclease-like (RecB) superfamily